MTYQRTILAGGGLVLGCIVVSILTFFLSQGPCPRTSFQCDNGTKCVTQKEICDGFRLCDDGEDEHVVTCGELYGGTSVLADNERERQNAPNYGHCYYHLDGCTRLCDPVPIMDCKGMALTHIPPIVYDNNMSAIISKVPPRLGIHMENNRIILEEDTLRNISLWYLDISHNNLSSLPRTLFAGQRHLRKLFLNGNNIEEIKAGSFSGLPQLKWLYLDNNKLTMFPFEDLASSGHLMWLDLSNNCLRLDGDSFPPLNQMWDLYLSNNQIQVIGPDTFAKLNQLEVLNLSHNRISYIHAAAFKNLANLRDLRLAHNQLVTLPDNILRNNHLLQALYLNHNPRINLTFAAYGELRNLLFLELAGIKYDQIQFDSINALSNLKFAIYDKFHYCSLTPHIIKCKPNTDGISSYSNLLENEVLRYSAWMMVLLTCLGNPLVLWIRVPKPGADNQHASTLFRNLAIADLLMGFYLLIIAVQDLRFRDVYHTTASDWVASWTCVASGVVAMISAEVSLLILAFISIDRFLMIADPCGGPRTRMGYRKVVWPLCIIWALGILLSVVPAIYYHSTSKFYGIYSGTCFPLHIEELFPLGWQYSAFVFFGVNLFLLIVIVTLYTGLLHSIRKTSRATTLPHKDVDLNLTIRFFFIVLTSASCWVVIVGFKLFAMLGYEFGTDLYGFVVVYLLPLNSAVNPLLYTFTAPDYWKRIVTKDWRTILKVKSENHHILTNGNCGSGNETHNGGGGGGGGGTHHYYSNQEDSNGKIVPSFNGKARSSGGSQKF